MNAAMLSALGALEIQRRAVGPNDIRIDIKFCGICHSDIHFARGEWGGEWFPDLAPRPGDIVAKEHWGQSGFANTDLDQQLRQRGITHVIIVGLLANTCIESTGRYAMEIGYHVTLVRDATAAVSREMMHAAHELNGPTFAHAILTTEQLLGRLPGPASTSPAAAPDLTQEED